MKTVIVYYSYRGTTKKYSESLSKETGADIFEVQALKRKSIFGVALTECPKSLMQKPTKIQSINLDLSGYQKIILAFPLWAGFPAPAFNNIVNMLPSGKEIEIIIVSSGGETKPENKEKVIALVNKTGSTVINYKDILNTSIK